MQARFDRLIGIEPGKADAGGRTTDPAGRVADAQRANGGRHMIGDAAGFGRIGRAKADGEFLTAQPAAQIIGTGRFAHRAAYGAQHGIAGLMPMAVVEAK